MRQPHPLSSFRRLVRWPRRSLSLLAATVALATPTWSWAQTSPQASEQPCYVEGISEQVLCGQVSVPENAAQADGKKIDIHYVILPAIKNANPEQALLAIAGGPGQSAIENAAGFDRMLKEVRQFKDILLIDQRGTGRSNILACDTLDTINALALNDEQQDARTEMARCLADIEADIGQYGSMNAIADFEAVRQQAGYSQLDLYGISYGSRMAQVYMKQYPQILRTVTLDGVVPMQQNILYISDAIARATELMLSDCQQDSLCQQRFPQLPQQLAAVEQQLAQAPLVTNVMQPRSGEPAEFTLTRSKFLGTIRMALYSPTTRALLPYAIEQAAVGNLQPILGLHALTLDGAGIAMGMHASVVCAEDIPFITPEMETMANGNYTGQTMLKALAASCDVWQVPAVDPSFHQPVVSDTPTLLLSGQLDPATPPSWGELAAVQLSNAQHLVAPYAGHGVAYQTCGNELIATLVKQGNLDTLDSQCLQKDVRRNFYLNANSLETLAAEPDVKANDHPQE
ncbi:alpha/beta hydrolase [Shewanella sp. NIFS-20-20]|uniref:alpha/beta hydrolase n=1 Tax=Shewanella sp. NIFS-20-20 TaxID=2853806 RepID=UPI001C47442C|nr:alpha/beta hydrolase [Shewanella sp. NIFS-20-20]MBV7317233.1 alpha/beta hydrolase [Shewanella sp. NIFS-20-20]